MKTLLKISCIALLVALVCFSCEKDDVVAPTPNDDNDPVTDTSSVSQDSVIKDDGKIEGIYTGKVHYQDSTSARYVTKGTITVKVVGDVYNFEFFDDVPGISNVVMREEDGGHSGSVNGYTGTIRHAGGKVVIELKKDDGAWWSVDGAKY